MNNSRCNSCGFISFATATECKKCGKPIKYEAANPDAFSVDDVWRDQDRLVLKHGAELPDRCIVCNAPAAGRRYPLKLTFDEKLHKVRLLAGTLKISYKETELPVGFCRAHLLRQAYSFFAGIFLVVFGLAVAFFSMWRENTIILLVGIAAGVVISGIGAYLQGDTPIKIEKSDESRFWLKGVCSAYLGRLPHLQ